MPGGRLRTYRLGDRNELLAEFVLNTVAFTTRVPRQEDVGHDLLCILAELKDEMFWAGPSFSVQVKSDRSPLVFEEKHQLSWLRELDNPFFIAVVYRDEQMVDLYSTWARLNGILYRDARRILLVPGTKDSKYEDVTTAPDRSEQRIPLGRPMLSTTIEEVLNESRAHELRRVLHSWVVLDRENIVRRQAGIYWVLGPKTYDTNKPIDQRSLVGFFYWHPKNLEACQRTFGRTATALRVVYRAALGEEGEKRHPFDTMTSDLDAVLRSHVGCLDALAAKVLKEQVGLSFTRPDEDEEGDDAEPRAG